MATSTSSFSSVASVRRSVLDAVTLVPIVLAVFRIGVGLLFMQHGAQKVFGWLGGAGGSGAPVELFSQLGLAGVLEFFGGALVVLGLFTRPVAVVLTLLMIAAYFIGHAPQGGFPIENHGESALLYALVFGLLSVAGAGAGSLDGWRHAH